MGLICVCGVRGHKAGRRARGELGRLNTPPWRRTGVKRRKGGSDSRGAGAKKEKVCRGRDGVGDNYGGEGGRVGSAIYGGHGSEEAYGKADGIVIYGITMKLRP